MTTGMDYSPMAECELCGAVRIGAIVVCPERGNNCKHETAKLCKDCLPGIAKVYQEQSMLISVVVTDEWMKEWMRGEHNIHVRVLTVREALKELARESDPTGLTGP